MPVNIADVDAFTDPVVAPDDGDDADGAIFQIGLQGLANRTRNLKNRADALLSDDNAWTGENIWNWDAIFNGNTTFNEPLRINDTNNEAVYSSTPRTRTKHAILAPSRDGAGNDLWFNLGESAIYTAVNNAPGVIRLPMPEGATLQSVMVVAFQGAASITNACRATVYLVTGVSAGANTSAAQGSSDSHVGTGLTWDNIVPSFTPFTPTSMQWAEVKILASDQAALGGGVDSIARVTYTYTETRATGS